MSVKRFSISVLLGFLVIIPQISIAEESVTQETPSQNSEATGSGMPPSQREVRPSGAPNTLMPPPRMGEGRLQSSSGTPPRMRENMIPEQSGKPPRPMIASGTKPLPDEMKQMMENRDRDRDTMMRDGRMLKPGSSSDRLPGKMGERMDEAKNRIEGERGERMKEFAKKTSERITTAIERFDKILERIDARIMKIQSTGADTSQAEGHVTKAREALTRAKALVAEAASLAQSFTPPIATSSESGDGLRTQPGLGQNSPMREPFRKAGEELRIAHKELGQAIMVLKGGSSVTENENASSSMKRPPKATSSSSITQ